ncbi:MAG: Trp biosynthesis-associated membrane protein [Streptosporangiaceae bacterium]
MTSGAEPRSAAGPHGLRAAAAARELTVTVLLGAAGAGLVFLATRQGWAHVRTIPPRPLPASDVTVTGAQLVPYADALVLAALGTLAAVLASRGLLRRIIGAALAALGAALAAAAFTVSTGAAISAANAGVGPAAASAGSVTDGSSAAAAVPNIAGAAPHVTLSAGGWQAMVVAGAAAMVGAGILVVCRARRLAVMSSRYDSPAGDARRGAAGQGRAPGRAPDSASIWEALSRGDDPTVLSAGRPPDPPQG